MRSPEDLAGMMAASGPSRDEQVRQTRFRQQLVADWQIPEGARVLEIGCGQGDTTAALADAVGPAGRVVAVDLAPPDYGAPVTIGESARVLSSSPLGEQIAFRFGFDVMDPSNAFSADEFDYVVLAHCTWYFESLAQLRETLEWVRPWAPRLCLSEWELLPSDLLQLAHHMAVSIRGQIEAYKRDSRENVRTPYSRETLRAVLADSGWAVSSESVLDSSDLADGRWETASCLASALSEAEEIGLPDKHRQWLVSQVDILRRFADSPVRSLPSYSIVALRSS